MDPREPAKPGHTFDPRPLEALEQELTRRVGARDRAFTVESWEFGGVQRPAAPRRAGLGAWVVRGALAAALAGVVGGVLALPQLMRREAGAPAPAPAARPAPAAATAAADLPRLDLLLAQRPQLLPSKPEPRPAQAPRDVERPAPPWDAAELHIQPTPEVEPPPDPAEATEAPPPPTASDPARQEPELQCDSAGGQAAQMACEDPDLAAKDRALGQATRRALAAGVPDQRLRREHAEWARARDEAAYAAPWSLPAVYDSRIEELNAEAEAAAAGEP